MGWALRAPRSPDEPERYLARLDAFGVVTVPAIADAQRFPTAHEALKFVAENPSLSRFAPTRAPP